MADKVFDVPGYVQNESQEAFFILQRRLAGGSRISFENAFKAIGKDTGLLGKAFIQWLKDNTFSDDNWVFYNEDGTPYFSIKEKTIENVSLPLKVDTSAGETSDEDQAKGAGKILRRQKTKQVKKGAEITPSSIIAAEATQAETLIAACRDKSVLKKALTLSNHFSNKEQHRRFIMERLAQV